MADEPLGFVLTDPTATFVAVEVFKTAKVDFVARAPSDDPTYVTADLGNSWARAFQDLNKWFDGTSSAGISGNTSTLLGALSVAEGFKAGGAALGKADVELQSTGGLVVVGDSETDATTKTAIWGSNHYTNTEEPMAMVAATAAVSSNALAIGGGVAAVNAATEINFYTAANNTTPTGSFRGQMTSAGVFSWSGASTLTGAVTMSNDLNHDGSNVGFYGTAPAPLSAAYTRTATIVEDRTLLASASATTINNNNVLAALIADLQAIGLIG